MHLYYLARANLEWANGLPMIWQGQQKVLGEVALLTVCMDYGIFWLSKLQ